MLDQESADGDGHPGNTADETPNTKRAGMRTDSHVTGPGLDHVGHLERAIKRRGSMCLDDDSELGELSSLRVT